MACADCFQLTNSEIRATFDAERSEDALDCTSSPRVCQSTRPPILLSTEHPWRLYQSNASRASLREPPTLGGCPLPYVAWIEKGFQHLSRLARCRMLATEGLNETMRWHWTDHRQEVAKIERHRRLRWTQYWHQVADNDGIHGGKRNSTSESIRTNTNRFRAASWSLCRRQQAIVLIKQNAICKFLEACESQKNCTTGEDSPQL